VSSSFDDVRVFGPGLRRIAGNQRLICCSVGCEDGVDSAGATRPDIPVGAHTGDASGVTPGMLGDGADPECAFGVADCHAWFSAPSPREGWASAA
jgi:hypothetical protein